MIQGNEAVKTGGSSLTNGWVVLANLVNEGHSCGLSKGSGPWAAISDVQLSTERHAHERDLARL